LKGTGSIKETAPDLLSGSALKIQEKLGTIERAFLDGTQLRIKNT
jgi:hypothetical protein